MRTGRVTSDTLKFSPQFISSNELRADRMVADPVQVFQQNSGGINFELSYPTDATFLSDLIRSAFFNNWVNTPFRDNDGTADSQITDCGTVANTVTVASGTAFVVGHLVRQSGFTAAANNGLFPVTTGGTTSYVSTGASYTADSAPAATARCKVVGFQGTSGDITATASGLGSTTLNFTTLGLAVGQWIKIGGTGANFRFATAAVNDWVRITAIAANALTCDNLPSGWATDSGTSKTIRVFFGDRIINGITFRSLSIEKAYLDQGSPTYILHSGMVVNTFNLAMQSRQMITGSVDFVGTSATQGTSANGASYDAATTESVMSANINVTRIAENGSTVASPNFVRTFNFQMQNNARLQDAVGNAQAIGVGAGELALTGTLETYFGSNAFYQKLLAGTATNLSARSTSGSRGLITTLPRVIFTDGAPVVTGKNTDVYLSMPFQASIDSLTSSQISADRFEYFE
jgi:hypothetical protein